jgi:hypothetical protein
MIFATPLAQRGAAQIEWQSRPNLDSALEGVFVNSGVQIRPDKAGPASASGSVGLAHESQPAVFASRRANTGQRETKNA